MGFYKVKVHRDSKTPRVFNVVAVRPQQAIQAAALQLKDEGITDAKGIEVIGQINSLRD
jgi:hypothetical protein